jgi:hypothetical protein
MQNWLFASIPPEKSRLKKFHLNRDGMERRRVAWAGKYFWG